MRNKTNIAHAGVALATGADVAWILRDDMRGALIDAGISTLSEEMLDVIDIVARSSYNAGRRSVLCERESGRAQAQREREAERLDDVRFP